MSKDPSECSLQTCPLDMAYVQHRPSIPGNAFYIGLFGVLLFGQVGLGFRFRAWSYTIPMICGLILEVLGYAGRIMIHSNPFNFDAFLLYLICLTIAPAFLTAAIYLCLGRIVIAYGVEYSRLKPWTYTYVFVSCDSIALLLQAAGGAVTSIADEDSLRNIGINVMISGLAFQVAALAGFMALAGEYGIRVRRGKKNTSETPISRHESRKHTAFLIGLASATVTIFIRSIFRVAELKGGFHSKLANDEVSLMILEGAMVSIACICLTVLHPGLLVGKNWRIRKPASQAEAKNQTSDIELS